MSTEPIPFLPKVLRTTLGEEGADALADTLQRIQLNGRKAMEETMTEKFERRLVEETSSLRLELREETGKLRTELKEETGKLRTELREETGKLRTEMKEEIGKLRAEFKEEISKVRIELKDETGKLWIAISELRAEMHAGFANIQDQFKDVYREIAKIHSAIASQTRWILTVVLGAVLPIYLALFKLLSQNG
ncbi:hypothetical protein EHQ61_10655 [Leptospira wolffii]|uniref:LA_3696 family protein n=1 Tax=Leptospira wolffii TaxID=409998 RepID=UPI0010838A5F|nr:hypothetical protein [Leptospira wolffii]TGL48941.1 hypothetical protein EHQ61_10655 [Leptospira wolffii]